MTKVPFFKKLSLLLAILLCSVLAFMVVVPATAKAVPAPDTAKELCIHSSDEVPFVIVAGEVSAGEVEGILQKAEKPLWSPLEAFLLQLIYPQSLSNEAIPGHHPLHSGSKLLHSILTKGP